MGTRRAETTMVGFACSGEAFGAKFAGLARAALPIACVFCRIISFTRSVAFIKELLKKSLSDPIGLPLSSHHLSGDGKTNDGLKNRALYQLF
jgi:hypothetical protein